MENFKPGSKCELGLSSSPSRASTEDYEDYTGAPGLSRGLSSVDDIVGICDSRV
ncbi:hypothetical protein RRG08_062335 [Elysia crispata]|uniref:Uncharacterized protein n=1 Tax=Elysia crispata TaxID=231223 RepID=A0AAE0YG62_9GAST|nr:hypothetical protein RRG08_062335 [Elysia crispata]